MRVLVYIAGWALWPVIIGALSARLLGVRIGRLRGAACGLIGVGLGALASNVWWTTGDATHDQIVFVFVAVASTLASLAALDFLARPRTIGQLERSIGSRPRPLRAARRRMTRTSRYLGILSIAWRRHLFSALTGNSRHDDQEHQERLGRDLSAALQQAGGMFVKLGQVLSTRRELLRWPGAVAIRLWRLR